MIYSFNFNLRKRPHTLQPYVYTVINKQIIVAKIRVAPFAFHFCVSFYVALADVVLSTRIMIFSYCCVTLSFFVSMVLCSVADWF
jgi:hypothetical protein